MMEVIEDIKTIFNNKVDVIKRRPDTYQLLLPIFHEDGDLVDIFIKESGGNELTICDLGKTLQRLSYEYDIDTPHKENILEKILMENNMAEDNGNLFMRTSLNTIFSDILNATQTFAKVGSMSYFKKEVIDSLFQEMLDTYIFDELGDYSPQKNILPIPDKPEFEVDYAFKPNGHYVYLMGIRQQSQARLAAINFLQFRVSQLDFRGWVVYESLQSMSKHDIARVSVASEKQFTSLDNFKEDIKYYLEKEKK